MDSKWNYRVRIKGRLNCFSDVLTLYKTVHYRQLVGVEEEFLHASEFGDIPTVKKLLDQNPELNVDCIDALGRTALRLAVKNEHLEVRLLPSFLLHVLLLLLPQKRMQ